MPAINLTAPFRLDDVTAPPNVRRLFLAGGISNCPDWQKPTSERLCASLDRTIIFNPRREDFDTSDPSATDEQIRWEFEYLSKSTHIVFWFPCETDCPITLFELGSHLRQARYGQLSIHIGCNPSYSRIGDVRLQSQLLGYNRQVHTSLETLCDAVEQDIGACSSQ